MSAMLSQLNGIFERRAKRQLLLAALGSAFVALLDTFAITLVLPLVDLATGNGESSQTVATIRDVLGDPSTQRLTLLLTLAVVILFVLKDAGALGFSWWMNGFVYGERVRTSARILGHILSSPYTEVSTRSSAEILRAADSAVLQVFNYTIRGLLYILSSLLAIVAMLVALFLLAPLPTLVLVAYFGVAALLFDKLAKPRAAAAGDVMIKSSLEGFRTAFAAVGAIKELQLRGTQEHFVTQFEAAQLRGAYAGRKAAFISGLPRYLLEILFILALGIVVALGSNTSVSNTSGPVGLLALFVAAGFRLLPAISALLANASSIRVGAGSLQLVHDEVEAARRSTSELPSAPAAGPPVAVHLGERLTVEGVNFRYPTSESDVLRDIWLDVRRGTSIAFVGGSGAGKTTLVDVILGLHRPTGGRVAVDGRDIASDLQAWQRLLGYVAQDVFLLDATLAENVAFDELACDIDRDRVTNALAQAQLEEVVAALPAGIDTQVGERGSRLSGGQRQRIGIARALYRDCQLLVLDEATSALDNETEHRINETIALLRGQMTVIVIAHRLSTVRRTDQIAFLDKGTVQCVGTFEEVLAASPEFARMVALGSVASVTVDDALTSDT